MAGLDDVKKAAIAAAISAYLESERGSAGAPFRPTMFLRQEKGRGAWGRLSHGNFGASGYRSQGRGNRA